MSTLGPSGRGRAGATGDMWDRSSCPAAGKANSKTRDGNVSADRAGNTGVSTRPPQVQHLLETASSKKREFIVLYS